MGSPLLPATADNAQGQLDSNIANSTLSIPLGSGEGALFPQPLTGTASSTGSSTTLNDTGDLGSVAVGDIIRNITDGSWAVVTSVASAPNAITTTALRGGSDNTWQSGDVWRIREFIITIDDGDAAGAGVTTSEKILISDRSTDTLTVPSGGRGYDGSSAAAWSSGDYVRLQVVSLVPEGIEDAIAEMVQYIDSNTNNIASNDTELDNIRNGAPFYAVDSGSTDTYEITLSPALTSYAAGQRLSFKASSTNTGAATLEVNGLGTKAIKKDGGSTDVAAGDIQNGQIVEVEYDGTYFQMISPPGQTAAAITHLGAVTTASSSVGASSTSETAMSPTWTGTNTVPANTFAVGTKIRIQLAGNYRLDSGNLRIRIKIGGNLLGFFQLSTATSSTTRSWDADVVAVCRTAGGSGALQPSGGSLVAENSSSIEIYGAAAESGAGGGVATISSFDTTSTQDVTVTAQFSASGGNHACNVQVGSIEILNSPS